MRQDFISSSWLPQAATVPLSSTTMRSARRTDAMRWAMISLVQSGLARFSASYRSASVLRPSALVESSKIRISASFRMARAMDTRCF